MTAPLATRANGRFAKGFSGNPAGRGIITPDMKRVSEYARQFSQEAIDVLRAIMRDKNASVYARIAAAQHVLDRAVGKPVTPVAVAVDDVQRSNELGAILAALREGGHTARERLLQLSHQAGDEDETASDICGE